MNHFIDMEQQKSMSPPNNTDSDSPACDESSFLILLGYQYQYRYVCILSSSMNRPSFRKIQNWWSRYRSIFHILKYQQINTMMSFKHSFYLSRRFFCHETLSLWLSDGQRPSDFLSPFLVSSSYFSRHLMISVSPLPKEKYIREYLERISEVLPTFVVSCSMVSSFLQTKSFSF